MIFSFSKTMFAKSCGNLYVSNANIVFETKISLFFYRIYALVAHALQIIIQNSLQFPTVKSLPNKFDILDLDHLHELCMNSELVRPWSRLSNLIWKALDGINYDIHPR